MTLDHIYPKALGGKHKASNLWHLCKDCNFQKGHLTWDEFCQLKELK